MSEVIDGNKVQSLEQLVYQDRIVSVDASWDCGHVTYCVKEFNQSTKTAAINVFSHAVESMSTTRMTNNEAGASMGAVCVSGIAGAEDMVCFLQGGAVHCMALGGGCQARLAGGDGLELQGFKVFTGPFNRIWMLAVVDVPVVPPAEKTPSQSSGMVFDSLMIRHWTEWNVYSKRNHLLLFELSVTPEGLLRARDDRPPSDVMQGIEADCPGAVRCR